MKKSICIFILSAIIGCSAPKSMLYNLDIPFTDNYIFSNDNKISVQLPLGWKPIDEKLINSDKDIHIIRSDSSAIISIIELRTSYDVRELTAEEDLRALALISFEMKKDFLKDSLFSLPPDEVFSIDGYKAYAYTFIRKSTQDTGRVVLFDTGKRFFEFSILPVPHKSDNTLSNTDLLFSTQQAVIKTFRWK